MVQKKSPHPHAALLYEQQKSMARFEKILQSRLPGEDPRACLRYDPRNSAPGVSPLITILVVLISVVALLAAVALFVRGMQSAPGGEPERYPFESRAPLTDQEKVLYWRLRKVLPEHIILSQVGLSRILRVQTGHDFGAWFNRVNRMTVDFLVCGSDASIVAAIELDDAIPIPAPDKAQADATKSKALASAGIKLLRFGEAPSEAELRAMFAG